MAKLCFYRTSQATSFSQAEREGATRTITIPNDDGHNLLSKGPAADAVDLIARAVDMMDGDEQIAYFLFTDDHKLLDHMTYALVGRQD